MRARRRLAAAGASLALAVSAVWALSGCNADNGVSSYSTFAGGDPAQGKQLIRGYGCGACHIIPGIQDARGLVGPPLFEFGQRTMIAGELPNTPDNLAHWLENPQSIEPKTAMPDLGVTPSQAYDMVAYLYTLRGSRGNQ